MNFVAHLIERFSAESHLTDAASGVSIGGQDLSGEIASMGTAFLEAGLKGGDRLVLCCDLTPSTAIAYLGAIYAGLVAVPVDQKVFREKAEDIFETTEPRGVWVPNSKFSPGESLLADRISIEGLASPNRSAELPFDDGDEDRLAALMMTSGSTGKPRFVQVTHLNLVSNTEAITRSQNLEPSDSAMLVMPINYVFGSSVLHSHLYAGGGVVFDKRFMFPNKVLEAIAEHGCTSFAGVPSAYALLLNHSSLGKIAMPKLKRFLQAGGALPVPSIRELEARMPDVKLYVMYGQTEATARITCLPPEMLATKAGSVGVALDNLSVEVIGENGEILEKGSTGELFVRGPSVSPGYWQEGLSEGVFWNGGLKTGDIGYCDSDGVFWITGRKGDFVKMRGYRVSLSEVNARVHEVEGVSECGSVRVAHPDAGEAVVVFISTAGVIEDDEALKVRIRKAVPSHWVLQEIHLLDEIPKNANGKISRTSLEQMAHDSGFLATHA